MLQCWRWYGPEDPVTLDHAKQAGAIGIVTALHQIYDGRAWPLPDILARKAILAKAGPGWNVVESIPVHNSIKTGAKEAGRYIGWYKDTMRNLAQAGVNTICYNFMPVVDWTRTDLMWQMPSTGYALRFDAIDFAAYDLFALERKGARDGYSPERLREAEERYKSATSVRMSRLERNLIAGLPATERKFDRGAFRQALAEYDGIGEEQLQSHLFGFLREIVPVAQELGLNMCIHPDDPPFPLYGLPRIVSTAAHIRQIFAAVDVPNNGLTFCVGSLGTRADNDLLAMAREFGPRIHFAHLRNVTREDDGSFHEADHLDGSSDMVAVIEALLAEEKRRRIEGRLDHEIPMRPDHGHLLADDIGKEKINPGYSLIGRLKGLAELRGVIRALEHADQAAMAAAP